MFEVLYANPWWTLLYLAVIGWTAMYCCVALRGKGPLINVHDESNHGHNCSRGPMDVGGEK